MKNDYEPSAKAVGTVVGIILFTILFMWALSQVPSGPSSVNTETSDSTFTYIIGPDGTPLMVPY